ncbi:hypothetical protein HMPREF9554_02722 [Treponema phagedenis F0421]|nr:hypothetical protein HMPREF9554_02722 [Treponema phagedenis F0421]
MVSLPAVAPCRALFITGSFKTPDLVFATDGKLRTMQNDV